MPHKTKLSIGHKQNMLTVISRAESSKNRGYADVNAGKNLSSGQTASPNKIKYRADAINVKKMSI